jgi:hypothetical protein
MTWRRRSGWGVVWAACSSQYMPIAAIKVTQEDALIFISPRGDDVPFGNAIPWRGRCASRTPPDQRRLDAASVSGAGLPLLMGDGWWPKSMFVVPVTVKGTLRRKTVFIIPRAFRTFPPVGGCSYQRPIHSLSNQKPFLFWCIIPTSLMKFDEAHWNVLPASSVFM